MSQTIVPGTPAGTAGQRGQRGQRHLPLEHAVNVRDIGGYATTGGGRTRWRAIVRAASLHALTVAEQAYLLAYGVRTIVDLRHPHERTERPNVFAGASQIAYVTLPLVEGRLATQARWQAAGLHPLETLYRAMLDERGAQIRGALELLGDASRHGVLVHCSAGKDRTGLLIALLLTVAGVAREDVVADYAISATCLDGRWQAAQRASVEALGLDWHGFAAYLDCRPELMARTLEYLDERHGGVQEYLAAAGLSPGAQATLRQSLVEPAAG
jgi:protein-tyrosine phosphatase